MECEQYLFAISENSFTLYNAIIVIFSGYAVGSLIGGILYKKVGGATTLRIFSMLAAISALMYLVLHILYLKHETPGEKSNILNRQTHDRDTLSNSIKEKL